MILGAFESLAPLLPNFCVNNSLMLPILLCSLLLSHIDLACFYRPIWFQLHCGSLVSLPIPILDIFVKLFNSSCIAFTQSTSFNAFSIFFGSMDDTNEKCSQNDVNLDLVCTPLEISPMIVSNGWSLAILVGWSIKT